MKTKWVWILSVAAALGIARATVMAAPCEPGAVLDHVIDTYGKDTAIAASRPRLRNITMSTGPLAGQTLELGKPKKVAEHFPNTNQSRRLVRVDGEAHVFSDVDTMERVVREVANSGDYLGNVRGWDRYGKAFDEPIGKRIARDGDEIPLHFGEIKIKDGAYHAVPRTRPAQ